MDVSTLLQQGNAWFFIPSAILLGALHGLEPGHSKTMMAAFIIAIKGTVKQAILLGLAATLSHTIVVWLIAFGGMYISRQLTAQAMEPWMQMISAIIILSTAAWMFYRTWSGAHEWKTAHHHDHSHHHQNLSIHSNNQEFQDAHERAHAHDIERRFSNKSATNFQILLFGLTGGLMPCPAAITVLLICIQLKALAVGATLVVSFSIGLALTLVTVGVGAAISVQQVTKRWGGFKTFARQAPYLSCLLITGVGIYMGLHGYMGLNH
ncbi:MAG: Nickel/cobalt efflux system RcnA [Candidatus Celerinatantimonas neptuna]|nr:MAG: Nickel/cobalt efflux system RcnA [Candidatus Celerinatantimonas neptuna]